LRPSFTGTSVPWRSGGSPFTILTASTMAATDLASPGWESFPESRLPLPGGIIASTPSCCHRCTARILPPRPLLRLPPAPRTARTSVPAHRPRRDSPGRASACRPWIGAQQVASVFVIPRARQVQRSLWSVSMAPCSSQSFIWSRGASFPILQGRGPIGVISQKAVSRELQAGGTFNESPMRPSGALPDPGAYGYQSG
jgi:hypothetical protein